MTSFFKAIAIVLPIASFMTGAASANSWRQGCSGAEYVCGNPAAAQTPVAKSATAKSSKSAKASTTKAKTSLKTSVANKKMSKSPKVAKAKVKAKVVQAEPKKAKPKAKIAKTKPSEKATGYQSGVASWYGGNFHGRKTANGETYDMYAMTAAHKTLPFGTRVRVTNANNGNSVVVRINDRGPFIAGRIIDLSKAAASDIGLTATGVAPVKVAILGKG